ncbi:MAG: RNA 2',3'-cyclic phosphodiesterase [Nitrososphaerota archaeon]
MVRAFLAVEASEGVDADKLTELYRRLGEVGQLKFVKKEQLHFTIKFFGDIPPATIETIRGLLSGLSIARFSITLKGIGTFPTPLRPRVIWIGVDEEGRTPLMDLAKRVGSLLAGKVPFDPKPFEPHLTVARVKSLKDRARFESTLADFRTTKFGSVDVKEIKLKESVLTSQGPIYHDLFSLGLE